MIKTHKGEKKKVEEKPGICSICGMPLIDDYESGERICPSCGIVVKEHMLDRGPEWKALDLEEKEKRVRTGSPTTLALHDFGLSTEISSTDTDSHGKRLSSQMRASAEKMRKWQMRIRASSPEERSLSNVLNRINILAAKLSLPRTAIETAAYLYRLAVRNKTARSKSIMGMTAASVYLACRKCNVGRTLKEVADAANLDKRIVAKYYRLVLKEVEKEYVPPPSVEGYISKLANIAKIEPKIERLALKLASQTNDTRISSGKAPAGLAAAYVYIASVLLSKKLPQREVAEAADVTEVTVRNRCREILMNFSIKQELKPIS
jgi:transcription initiation factor TFIIB